jgi:hypothetical protein
MLNVINKNYAPKFLSLPVTMVAEGSAYRYHLKSQDPDRDGVSYRILEGPEGMRLDNNTLYWQPGFDHSGSHGVKVEVSDGDLTAIQSFVIQVENTNRTPEFLKGAADAPKQAIENSQYQYRLEATDADQQALEYRLIQAPEGMTVDAKSGLIQWTPGFNQAGEAFVVVEVTDPEKATARESFVVAVTDVNQAPEITSQPLLTVTENTQWRYRIDAIDADEKPLTYQLVSGPEGMTLDTFNTLRWTPGLSAAGVYPVVVAVSDGQTQVDQSFELTVENLNQTPVIQSSPELQAQENIPYTYQVIAEDKDGDTIHYQLTTAPEGMMLDAETGLINWTPGFNQAGTHPIEVIVTDSHQAQVAQTFTLDVINQNRAPVFASAPEVIAEEGLPYRYHIDSQDPDIDDLTFTLKQAPVGMVFNPQQRTLFWHPDVGDAGEYQVTLTATDGELESDHSFTVSVNPVQPSEVVAEQEVGLNNVSIR